MPKYIIKIKDKYFEWSTVVDAPISYGMTLDELHQHTLRQYGKSALDELPERLERVAKKGTSSCVDASLADLLQGNHAGDGETELTADQIYAKYANPHPVTDSDYESKIIKSFKKGVGGHSLTFDDGWLFWMPEVGFAPEVGQTAKLYGRGLGFTVRGLVVNDRVVFYRTEAEQAEQDRKERAASEAKKRTDYDAQASEYDRRVNALPLPFKTRILDFRNWKPETWKYDFEPYELFACEQAVEIANALKTPEEIIRFHKLDFPEQKKLVPALSDDHSGNTFGAACQLASVYLTKPDMIPEAHGALCPLVGCKDYGCAVSRGNK